MPRYSINPSCLLDRPWRCGHPFRPHRGRFRRWAMGTLFCLLSLIIGGYTYLTDSNRVRTMAQAYLSHLLGGRVEIGGATLSIFEGLRIDDVKVHVDAGPGRPDSLLFSARSFLVNYDPRKLIRGQLDATEIIAQKPHVYLTLTQKPRGDQWNYQRLAKGQPAQTQPAQGAPSKLTLPSLLLRNAVIEISEVKAGQVCPVGSMDIDGQLTPAGDGEHYQFQMQSRGVSEGLGPYASGTIAINTGELAAHLRNVQFSEDIRSMFPADLRDWWERHALGGRIESVDVTYAPSAKGKPKFSVATTVKGITLTVHREEWSTHDQIDRWQRTREAVALAEAPYRIAGYAPEGEGSGFRAQGSVAREGEAPAEPNHSNANIPGSAGASPSQKLFLAHLNPELRTLNPLDVLSDMTDTAPVLMREVSGSFLFDQDRIEVKDLLVRVGSGDAEHPDATNAFVVSGSMEGYGPDAPFHLAVRSADGKGMYFPAHPTFIDSLPPDVKQIYDQIKPQGWLRALATVDRVRAGEAPQVGVQAEIVDAGFYFHEFQYPFQRATGKVAFRRDPFTGKNYVYVTNVHANGKLGGPNEHAVVSVSGRVGPIGPEYPEPGFDMVATGTHICSEPALTAAMPPDVREALSNFDAPGNGEFPKFQGNFVCKLHRPSGRRQRVDFVTDVDVADASGRVKGFPYLLQHAKARFQVHDGYVDILEARGHNETNGTAAVKGRVRWAEAGTFRNQPLEMNLTVNVHGMPVDDELVAAVPPEYAVWLKKLGIGGTIDGDGRIFTVVPDDWHGKVKPTEKAPDPPILFDLNLAVRDGTIWPADGMFSLSSVAGRLHLTHDRLDILDLHGRREAADIAATGKFTFAGAAPQMKLHVAAHNLTMDRPLYAMLPPEGRSAWDEVRPEGTVDADIDYNGALGGDGGPAQVALASAAPKLDLAASMANAFHATLRPRKLAVTVRTAPYPLTFTGGSVEIVPGHAVLDQLVGTHGKAKLVVSGEGSLGAAPAWNLTLHGEGMPIDDEFHKAMPPIMRDILDALKLRGTIGFDFSKLSYRGSASTQADPDIDVAGTVSLKDASLDAGMPMTDVQGGMRFAAGTRAGKFDGLSGALAFESLKLGGRPMRDLRFDLSREPGHNDLHIDHFRAAVAGGEVGGGGVITFPDQGANRYTMNLAVRNADVRALTGEADADIRGELTASLALEGKWDDPAARRGRGDVVVAGKQLYRIPLMLGLMQVTNLALPIGQPFTRGTARYTVEGNRINFEQMDLRADAMAMSGTGYLDFGTKQVRLSLTTDNPAGFKIPFITDLWRGARQELLRIDVQGTVQDPKVQPTSMGVITTTIDQVFKGENPRK
ncbi:MAG TPA: hypothetical protein VGI81_28840 [Tepidisphaeraceae bacterium]